MARVDASIRIQAPPEAVWRVTSDPRRYTEYVHFIREVYDISEGPVGVGTTYRERAKPGPTESISEWRISAFEPPRREVIEGQAPDLAAVLSKELEAVEEGTQYYQAIEFRFLPRLRPLGWLLEQLVIRRKMKSDFNKIVSRIKEIVEAERSP